MAAPSPQHCTRHQKIADKSLCRLLKLRHRRALSATISRRALFRHFDAASSCTADISWNHTLSSILRFAVAKIGPLLLRSGGRSHDAIDIGFTAWSLCVLAQTEATNVYIEHFRLLQITEVSSDV